MKHNKQYLKWSFVVLCVIFGKIALGNEMNQNYRIYITDIQRNVHKNWLAIPRSVDFTVYWDLYQDKEEGWNPVSPDLLNHYRICCKGKWSPGTRRGISSHG